MAKTVYLPAQWMFPARTNMAGGHPIIEGPAVPTQEHRDTFGVWASNVNAIYANCKPPLVAMTPCCASSTTSEISAGDVALSTLARFKIPTEFVGTGSGEQLVCRFKACIDSAVNAGTIKAITYWRGGATDSDTVAVTGTAWAWYTITIDVDDTIDAVRDVELVIEGSVDDAADTLYIRQILVHWAENASPLPDGPYSSDFLPLETTTAATHGLRVVHTPICVEHLRRLSTDLLDLKHRRCTGGMIISTWNQTYIAPDASYRAVTWQYEDAQVVQIWVRAYATALPGVLTATLANAETSVAAEPVRVTTLGAAGEWYEANITWPSSHRNSTPTVMELSITSSQARVLGCSAWWREL